MSYTYEDRELFESILVELGYAEVTVQVYSSGICNPAATAHKQAKTLWIKHMDGLPLPKIEEKIVSKNRSCGHTAKYNGRLLTKRGSTEREEVSEDAQDVPSNQKNVQTETDIVRFILDNSLLNDDKKMAIIRIILQ